MTQKHMVFSQNNELIAVPLDYVQEVLKVDTIRKIRRSSDKFLGIINLRGSIMPILNFNKFLFPASKQNGNNGLEHRNNGHTAVVFKFNKETFGILVDDVKKIVEFSDENFENLPSDIATRADFALIETIVNMDGSPILCINIKKIMEEKFAVNVQITQEPRKEAADDEKPRTQPKKQTEIKPKAVAPAMGAKSLSLTKDQLDALKEISNIATGKAVIAMSKLFKAKTKISIVVDDVLVKRIDELGGSSIIKLDEKAIGIRSNIKRDLDASIFLAFQVSQMKNLLELMEYTDAVPKEITNLGNLDKQTESALVEFGNIIVSHYCAGISDFLKIQVDHDVPKLAIDLYGAMIDGEISKLATHSNQALVLKTIIETQKKTIVGELIFIPYSNSVENLVKWLNVDKIVELLGAEAEGVGIQDLQKVQTEKAKIKKKASKDDKLEIVDVGKYIEDDIFAKVKTQTDFNLGSKEKDTLKIDNADLDTFRELGNMGAGNAGNALSQMLNKKVFLEIPPAKVLTLPELMTLPIAQTPQSIGYLSITKGLFDTIILLLFSTEHVENLLQAIMETKTKKALKKETDLSENERSAVQEMLNILMGHYVSAMSNFLKVKIDPPENTLFFKKTAQLFNQLKLDEKNQDIKAVVIETSIDTADAASIKGTFILLLHPRVIHNILDRIKEIW